MLHTMRSPAHMSSSRYDSKERSRNTSSGSTNDSDEELDELLKISGLQTKVNYNKLDRLLKLSGLLSRENQHISRKAHRKFLAHYPKIFIKERPLPGIPLGRSKWVHSCLESHEDELDQDSHNIRVHVDKIKNQHRRMRSGSSQFIEKLQSLLPILKKIPIQRTPEEHEVMFTTLKIIPDIRDQLSDVELKELSKCVVKEEWDRGTKVDGSHGFFILLKGSAKSQSSFYKKFSRPSFAHELISSGASSHSSTHSLLGVGKCFGILSPYRGRLKADMLSVITEESCIFLKIPCRDYLRVKEEIIRRVKIAKEELIRGSPYYQNWPMVFIFQLTAQLRWMKFPTDHVFMRIGEINDYVGFIKSGSCNAYQIIPAIVKRPLGKMIKQFRQVLIGQLHPKQSFGEINILLQIPSTYTLKAATPVELGIIEAEDILDLDPVIQQLILQSVEPSFENVTYEDLKFSYIKSEKEKEWTQKKDIILKDSLFYNGISPGVGRWVHEHIENMHQQHASDVPEKTQVLKTMQALEKYKS